MATADEIVKQVKENVKVKLRPGSVVFSNQGQVNRVSWIVREGGSKWEVEGIAGKQKRERREVWASMEKRLLLELGFVALFLAAGIGSGEREVSYDGRSLIIHGQRKLLFSASIHYPRSTPEMWTSLIAKAKEGGIDVIQTYVFWNLHEPVKGQNDILVGNLQYDFSGRADIVRFIKEIQAQGLYASLRIGPFIEAEWNYGGLPFWLHDIPGIVYRCDNEPFKMHMQNFTTKIVNMMKSESLYASQGGPIVLSQIENEYQLVEDAFHEKGPPYVKWAAQMAVELQTGVPWMMCKQYDAPDPLINTCNGMKCGESFPGPNSPKKPWLWTENWTSQYQAYGKDPITRSPQDIAFQAALFIARNGTFVNYYMYHGGTNFGRTASAFTMTSYYDDAPLDEYGFIRQPKWGHLKQLNGAIKSCSSPILFGAQSTLSLGPKQMGYIYRQNSGECAAFLVNRDDTKTVVVRFRNSSYELGPNSVSILPDCKNINVENNMRSIRTSKKFKELGMWEEFRDIIPRFAETSMRSKTLLEHMNTTKDKSDYLWYTFSYQHGSSNGKAVLKVQSAGHVLHAFVNGVLVGSAHGSHKRPNFRLENTIPLNNGSNNISLLSVTVGLRDSGAYLESRAAGLRRVKIHDIQKSTDLTYYRWGYQVGLIGEKLQIYMDQSSSKVEWTKLSSSRNPLTWYKTRFDAPADNLSLGLNLGSMGKGEVWVNGQSIGRYWASFLTPQGAPYQTCSSLTSVSISETSNLIIVCALVPSNDGLQPSSLNCSSFQVPGIRTPFNSNVSFSGIVSGDGFVCGLRHLFSSSNVSVMHCWRFSRNGSFLDLKRIYMGPVLNRLEAGNTHICGLNETDGLECWQWPGFNQTGGVQFFSDIAVGEGFVCGLTKDGKTIRFLGNFTGIAGQEISGNYSLIAAGFSHVCAINSDGGIECWGNRNIMGDEPQGQFKELALGLNRSCALRTNGTVVCWGMSNFRLQQGLESLEFITIKAKSNVFCGVSALNYSLFCWGDPNFVSNPMVFSEVLPGPCRNVCPCGSFPGSGLLCSNGGSICQACTAGAISSAPSPQPENRSSNSDLNDRLIAFLVVCVGSFSLLLVVGFFLFRYCRDRGCRVHDSGPLDETGAPTNGGLCSNRTHQTPPAVLEKRLSQLTSMGTTGRLEEFSFEALVQATNNFSEDHKIGTGSFGSVYHATLDDGREVAIKRAEITSTSSCAIHTRRQEDRDDAFVNELNIRSTIDRYKKASSDTSNTNTVTEINAQYYQQESAKLRQQIQMIQNTNRHLMGDSLSTLTVKELKQVENRLERGITRIRSKKHEMLLAEIEYLQKREIELENESVCLRTKIAEVERVQQANMVTGPELNAIQALASRNFFSPNVMDPPTAYSDKKILHLGYY
ncbi:hypothetical protein V6N13_012303 [Hibiscus sabdariffa]